MFGVLLTVKNLGENLSEKQSTIIKRNFRSSTKHLSLDSTIPVDELTVETFYHFRTNELFSIWTPPFCTDPSTWQTNDSQFPVRDYHTNLKKIVSRKVFHFINNEDQEALCYKTRRCKDAITSFRENKALGHLLHVFSSYSHMWQPLK